MKKLLGMPFEQHCKWTLGAESIIDIAIININYCKYLSVNDILRLWFFKSVNLESQAC